MAKRFTGFKATRKTKQCKEMHGRHFQRLQNTKEGKADVFRDKIKRSRLELKSLKAKTQKAKNN